MNITVSKINQCKYKCFSLIMLLLLLNLPLQGKQKKIIFNKIFETTGNDVFYSIQPTDDKCYVASGMTESKAKNKSDMWIIKINQNAEIVWEKTYGGPGWNKAKFVKQTKDHGYIGIGETIPEKSLTRYVRIFKLDEDGDLDWGKIFQYGDDNEINCIQELADGNFIITGSYFLREEKKSFLWVMKLDKEGKVIWSKKYGGSDWDCGNYIQQTVEGGFIITGHTQDQQTLLKDLWLVKINQNGGYDWQMSYGNGSWNSGRYVYASQDNDYSVIGYTYSLETKKSKLWFLKVDSRGSMIRGKIYGGDDWNDIKSVQMISNNGWVLVGYTKSEGKGKKDAWVVRLDKKGDLIWEKPFGDIEDDEAFGVCLSPQGEYVIAGYTTSPEAEKSDPWIFKVNENGEISGAETAITNLLFNQSGIKRYTKLWDKTLGHMDNEESLSMILTKENGFALSGFAEDTNRGIKNALVAVFDKKGNLDWEKQLHYNNNNINVLSYIQQTEDEGYILTGYTSLKNQNDSSFWIVKLNSRGDKSWEQVFGDKGDNKGLCIKQINENEYLGIGYQMNPTNLNRNISFMHLNKNGEKVGQSTYQKEGNFLASDIEITSDNGFIIVGNKAKQDDDRSDTWVLRLNAEGEKIWEKILDKPGIDGAYSVIETKRGGFLISGYGYQPQGNCEARVIRLNKSGNLIWDKTFSRSLFDEARSGLEINNEEFLITGNTFSQKSGGWDIWIFKLDKDGQMIWNNTYGGMAEERVNHLIDAGKDEYALTGCTASKGSGGLDALILKFNETQRVPDLFISTEPTEVDLLLNNVYEGKTPLNIANIQPGTNLIVMKKKNYFTSEKKLVINNTSSDRLFYDLEPVEGTFIIISKYDDVNISINNVNEAIEDKNGIFQKRMKIGQYNVVFSKKNYNDVKKTITITSGETNLIIIDQDFFDLPGNSDKK